MTALVTLLAFIIDWIAGDPQGWPHPVRGLGRLISRLEQWLRPGAAGRPASLRGRGVWLALTTVLAAAAAAGLTLGLTARLSGFLWFLAALYLVYSALCLKDLYFQTWRVEKALRNGDLEEARRRLSWVVGRDTGQLGESDIRRAVVETLAENFSDGLVAPLFYLALGGPVLAWAYKAVNTLDSMVGYKNQAYLHLGRFSARLDDAANYIPARLAALLIVLAARLGGYDHRRARLIWRRDGGRHTSPNSGRPEAAMAGALAVRLGGPGYYGGLLVDKPVIHPEGGECAPETLRAAEQLVVSGALLMLLLTMLIMLSLTGSWGWFR